MTIFEQKKLELLTAYNPYFGPLLSLYTAGSVPASFVHSCIAAGYISYAEFYAIVSTLEPELAKTMLKADVVAGLITPAQYEAITGEPYSA